MSFGYSAGDAVLLVQLAKNTYQGAKKACGEHDELTGEVGSLHQVLQRLQRELSNPDSPLNRAKDDRRQELRTDNWEDMIVPGLEIMMKVWPHPKFSYGKVPTGVITCPVNVSRIGVLGGTVYPWAPGLEYYGNNNISTTAGHSQSHGGLSSSEMPTTRPPLARSGWDKVHVPTDRMLRWMAGNPKKASSQNPRRR